MNTSLPDIQKRYNPKAQIWKATCPVPENPNGRHWWDIGQDNKGKCRYCGETGYFPSMRIGCEALP